MLRGCRWCLFAAAIVFGGASFAQTDSTGIHIVGEAFMPTAELCFEAFEEGLIVEKVEGDDRIATLFRIYYKGDIFRIIIGNGGLRCNAWHMKAQ